MRLFFLCFFPHEAFDAQLLSTHSISLKASFMPEILDATDRRILKELQANGRISNAELAERINASAATDDGPDLHKVGES